LDPNDKTNLKDLELVDQVMNQERVVVRHSEKNDFATAVNYLTQILAECPASERHSILKLQYLLKSA